jgi:polyphosphate kinase
VNAKRKTTKQRHQPAQFLDRELSWLEFNARVLGEALQPELPPLERLKFLSIVSSNLDEFFMVRVAAVRSRPETATSLAGMMPAETLQAISERVRDTIAQQYKCLLEDLLPAISTRVKFSRPAEHNATQRQFVHDLFRNEIFPTLTPLKIGANAKLTFGRNLILHILFELTPAGRPDEQAQMAVVPVPGSLDRFCNLPVDDKSYCCTLIEDIIIDNAAALFPGYEITDHLVWRVTRDADPGVDEERDEDFVAAMAEMLVRRQHGGPVRLETDTGSGPLLQKLQAMTNLRPRDTYLIPGPIDLKPFVKLAFLPGLDSLRQKPWQPQQPRDIPKNTDIFELLQDRDALIHLPYESFDPIIQLLSQAAADEHVLAIKITLYRTSGDSPIIDALACAAVNGKQVTAVVELKARFDEEQNIGWVDKLQRVGVIVIYGIAELKIHSKACMIVRRERSGIQRYVHLGTGNYNDRTARLYSDLGLLTTNEQITYETALFFNSITGYSSVPGLRHLAMAPVALKSKVISLIRRESERTNHHDPGSIMAKLNSLADPDVIEVLYEASQAGVRIQLNIRGVCQLVPGVKGLSDNIRVVSIVDGFLEHSRILCVRNGGAEELYLSSADWMPRNLEHRVELMFPVEQDNLKRRLVDLLELYFSDNTNSHELQSDGTWIRQSPKRGRQVRAQERLCQSALQHTESLKTSSHKKFTVRRGPPS